MLELGTGAGVSESTPPPPPGVIGGVPGVPDDELVAPRGDEEVVRQHDEVARREPRPGELQLRERPHLIINGGDCNTIMIMRQLVGQESRAMSND